MPVCQADGVVFQYPEGWELTREVHGSDVTWHLQTAGSAFWSLTLLASCPTADEAVDAVLAAYEEEYPQVDIYRGPEGQLPGPAAGCDLDFSYLDLVNSARIRAEATNTFTALVVYQGEDRDIEALREQFEAITGSLRYQGDWGSDEESSESQSHHHHDHDGHDCGHDHG
ncbi:hypothetical protein GC163_07495 [bacterium]|nr:hypothetical protein [bacterium]